VVTLGDSYISGEAGRWAGSSNDDSARADALGPSAYHDAGDHEAIERCHRSRSAEAYVGGGVNGLNLACSGAETATTNGDNFKPANVAAVRARIAGAFQNVATAMRNAGYADGQWTLLAQTYPSPIPRGDAIRYSQSGYSRQFTGGCGFWNADADWANDTALPTINGAVTGAAADSGLSNVRTLDLASAFNGRRLCENTVGLYEEKGIASWLTPGAVDQTEWVNQIRTVSTCCADSPYYIQESIHPNYWGQLATRSCVRQAWNGGSPRGGTCTIAGNGLANGEPVMALN
jgi:hypothetical protein